MAGGAQAVVDFQQTLVHQLEGTLATDLTALAALKTAEGGPNDASLQAWDTAYLLRKHKETLGVDEALVQEYFPMEHVKSETLRIYEELLCLKYTRLPNAEVCSESFHSAHANTASTLAPLDCRLNPGDCLPLANST